MKNFFKLATLAALFQGSPNKITQLIPTNPDKKMKREDLPESVKREKRRIQMEQNDRAYRLRLQRQGVHEYTTPTGQIILYRDDKNLQRKLANAVN